jgi:hypothetical protein
VLSCRSPLRCGGGRPWPTIRPGLLGVLAAWLTIDVETRRLIGSKRTAADEIVRVLLPGSWSRRRSARQGMTPAATGRRFIRGTRRLFPGRLGIGAAADARNALTLSLEGTSLFGGRGTRLPATRRTQPKTPRALTRVGTRPFCSTLGRPFLTYRRRGRLPRLGSEPPPAITRQIVIGRVLPAAVRRGGGKARRLASGCGRLVVIWWGATMPGALPRRPRSGVQRPASHAGCGRLVFIWLRATMPGALSRRPRSGVQRPASHAGSRWPVVVWWGATMLGAVRRRPGNGAWNPTFGYKSRRLLVIRSRTTRPGALC